LTREVECSPPSSDQVKN